MCETGPARDVLEELTRANGELVNRLRELARERVLRGTPRTDPLDDDVVRRLAEHVEHLRDLLSRVEAPPGQPGVGRQRRTS